MAQQEYRGVFGLPDQSRQVPGTIVRDSVTGDILLELDERLDATATPFDMPDYPVLHGTLTNGAPATLLKCSSVRVGSAVNADRTAAECYSCRQWVAGRRVTADERYSHVMFGLSDLVEWSSFRPFHTHTDFSSGIGAVTIQTESPIVHSAATVRGLVEFITRATVSATPHLASIGSHSCVRITPSEPVTLIDALRLYCRPLQDLVTIGTGRPQEVLDLRLLPARYEILDPNASDNTWCEVHFSRWTGAPASSKGPVRHEMLFTLPDLVPNLTERLNKWFDLDENVHEVRTLATGIIYRSGMFADQRFIYAAHAAETYHRRRLGGLERDPDEHRQMMAAIVGAVPDEYRSWLKDKLAFANEVCFIARLEQLRDVSCEVVRSHLGRIPDWEKWIRDTRNYHTHYTSRPGRRSRVARGPHMLALTESLLLLIEDRLLSELGLSDMARNTLIIKTRRARRLFHWASELQWNAS